VGAAIDYALQRGGTNANEVYAIIAQWANRKYGLNLTYEHFNGKGPEQIFQELRQVNEEYLGNGQGSPDGSADGGPDGRAEFHSAEGTPDGRAEFHSAPSEANLARPKSRSAPSQSGLARREFHSSPSEAGSALQREIDVALQKHDGDELVRWARQRFGSVMETNPLQLGGDLREQLQHCAYEMLRYELTQLERYVLLNTFDGAWKDHMYSMDLLRHSIGLRGYAEQDPKIAYKREGTRMFTEMLENIRERVTDLIFKVRIAGFGGGDYAEGAPVSVGPAPGGGSAYTGLTASKADATGAGYSAADQEAALRQQGEGGQPKTIRRETPRVGRNDPCPCGSGKKYKHCHGRGR
jgi:hypothetical protein